MRTLYSVLCFFFNDTATTEIYTLSLHDALPISPGSATVLHIQAETIGMDCSVSWQRPLLGSNSAITGLQMRQAALVDRKSTRLNSSHQIISYAVFSLKKKKNNSHTCIHIYDIIR